MRTFSMLQYYINCARRYASHCMYCTVHTYSKVWIVIRIARLFIVADENEVSKLPT